jgi:superfamily II DNA or RNA helicase
MMKSFTPHYFQQDSLDLAVKGITVSPDDFRGRIVMPTGSGKTLTEALITKWQIENNSKNGIHLVLAPRIMLGNQLLKEFRMFLGKDTFRAIAFHSGEHKAEDGVKWKESATTRVSEVKEALTNAKILGQPLIVFSTYHSCHKLEDIEFDTIIADESQYCVAENFNSSFKALNGRARLSFTATEKFTASDTGFGLNNEELYGPRIYYIEPKELIAGGYIVPPRLHILHGDALDEGKSIVSQVKEIAREQIRLTKPNLGFAKVLFAMSGTDDVKTINDNIKELRDEFEGYDILTITSNSGARMNGKEMKRSQWMKELRDRDNCLIFHYDILSEGIDVDGITGVAIMRNMGLAKLLQTIGRALRLYKPNPSLKPWALITVPALNGNEDDAERVGFIIRTLRNGGYDISIEDIIETKKNRHEREEDDMDDAFEPYKNNFSSLFIEEVFHEIENDEFWFKVAESGTIEEEYDLLLGKE